MHGTVAQASVERPVEARKVGGSIPSGATVMLEEVAPFESCWW